MGVTILKTTYKEGRRERILYDDGFSEKWITIEQKEEWELFLRCYQKELHDFEYPTIEGNRRACEPQISQGMKKTFTIYALPIYMKILLSVFLVLLTGGVLLYMMVYDEINLMGVGIRIPWKIYLLLILCLPLMFMWVPPDLKEKTFKQRLKYGLVFFVVFVSLILLSMLGIALFSKIFESN